MHFRATRLAVLASLLALIASLVATVPALATGPTITSFTPTSAGIAAHVTIHGTALTGAKTVKFNGAAAVFTVTSASAISATVPATASTGPISVTSDSGTATSSTSFTVAPSLTESLTTGPPTTSVKISGAGFRAYERINLYFDTTALSIVAANAKGNFGPVFVTVPSTAASAKHWISAEGAHSSFFAQLPFTVNVNWTMDGFGAAHHGLNPYENTISVSNVNQLNPVWSADAGGFSNNSPFIESAGNTYVGDVNGNVHAYSGSGTLLWQASPGSGLESVTPAAAGGRVFFGNSAGNVYAYNALCHSNGAACTPLWTASVGTAVPGGLTIYKGMLYVPSSDGSIHTFNPATGAEGAPVYGYDQATGGVTTPITFGVDGSFYYGTGTTFQYGSSDASGSTPYGGTVSPVTAYNGAAYFTTSDGNIYEFGNAGWSAPTSGTGCAPAPVAASGMVFAGGCTSLTAFDAGAGSVDWSVTTPGPVVGLTLANGVLYGCVNSGSGFSFTGIVVAYDASYGGKLWSGGRCSGHPVVANGWVYAADAHLFAYNLSSAGELGSQAPVQPTRDSLGLLFAHGVGGSRLGSDMAL